jgi:hypothetical protein
MVEYLQDQRFPNACRLGPNLPQHAKVLYCKNLVLDFLRSQESLTCFCPTHAAGDENIRILVDEPLCRREAYAAASACDDCNFSFKLFHNYLFVLVGLKFVRVVQLDTYYVMISDVEHPAGDPARARTSQKDDPVTISLAS